MPKTKPLTTKTAFIRSQPPEMPARDVVKKAHEAGLKMSVAYVYTIRSSARRGRGRPAKSSGRAVARATSSIDIAFRKLVLELGIVRARALLDEIETRLGDLVARG